MGISYFSRNIFSFCQNRSDQGYVDAIVAQANYFDEPKTVDVDERLKVGDYISVITWLCCKNTVERQRCSITKYQVTIHDKSLVWLRNHAVPPHTPLIYERAIFEFLSAPTVTTLHMVSIPLIKAASSCVLQDCVAMKDLSERKVTIMENIEESYLTYLEKLSKKFLNCGIEEISERTRVDRAVRIREEILIIAEKSLLVEIPETIWLSWYEKEEPTKFSDRIPFAEEHRERTRKFAKSVIKQLRFKGRV